MTAPSVNQGEVEGGIQVNGASGAENAFTVDGVVTNRLVNGQSRQNAVFEYLQEVQVKTSGISAEYGGALGGVVSAVTKSGGNTFRGEGHYYYEGSALSAGAGEAARAEPVRRPYRHLRPGPRAARSTQRVRRIVRRPDRPRPAVLLRLVLAAQRERKTNTLQLHRRLQRHRARHLATAGVRQADVRGAAIDGATGPRCGPRPRPTAPFRPTTARAERVHRQRVLARAQHRPRLRDQPGEHERHLRPDADQHVVPQRSAAGISTTATATPASR